MVERNVCVREVGGWVLGASCPWAGPFPPCPPAWLLGQFRACAHLEAIVSSCRAGLRLRSGPAAPALETSQGPSDTPPEQGLEAKEKGKNRIRAGGGEDLLFVLKNLLAFPHKSEEPVGEATLTPGTPTPQSGKPEAYIWFCFYSNQRHSGPVQGPKNTCRNGSCSTLSPEGFVSMT